jgi:superfamily II DNA or RNA helicase
MVEESFKQGSLPVAKEIYVLESERFPNNDGKTKVAKQLHNDLNGSSDFLVISGYGGLGEIIDVISSSAKDCEDIRLLFGHEINLKNSRKSRRKKMIQMEMKDYWIKRKLSPIQHASVVEVIERLESGLIKVRMADDTPRLHAKMYRTRASIIFGSSNFTYPGLHTSREMNQRHSRPSDEYNELSKYMESVWELGTDCTEFIQSLLDQLLRTVSWTQSLARGCSELLDGAWADEFLIGSDYSIKLWPHQKQGIAQALALLESQGAVVVADATGSGKTRTGAWLIRSVFIKMVREGGHLRRHLTPLLLAPKSVTESWRKELLGSPADITSDGLISRNTKRAANAHESLQHTNVLAVDEVHRYYDKTSARTKQLLNAQASSRMMFTATPINKTFNDIFQLLALLNEDLPVETQKELANLNEIISSGRKGKADAQARVKQIVSSFMVRRTRDQINQLVDNNEEEYRLESGKIARYPEYSAKRYALTSNKNDLKIVKKISLEIKKIRGLSRIKSIDFDAENFQSHLEAVVNGAKGLAMYQFWKALNSSRPAAIEHIVGTEQTRKEFDLKKLKRSIKGIASELQRERPKDWDKLNDFDDLKCPKWMIDDEAFADAHDDEAAIYATLHSLVSQLSDERDQSKLNRVLSLQKEHGKVLAFDWSVSTLHYFEGVLSKKGHNVICLTGDTTNDKITSVDKAETFFGLESNDDKAIGLFSDAFSEGINLQGTKVLLNLTNPTTIRVAEQRAGRVDRLNTIHDSISILYPDHDQIGENLDDKLAERHGHVASIGRNLKLPEDEIIDEYTKEIRSSEIDSVELFKDDDLRDAFYPVRQLVEGSDALISKDDYDLMKDVTAQVISHVSLVRSDSKWCFLVLQTEKNWAPQWVFLDWRHRNRSRKGIDTNLESVVQSIRLTLDGAEDLPKKSDSGGMLKSYLNHLQDNEWLLLPSRQRSEIEEIADFIKKTCRDVSDTRKLEYQKLFTFKRFKDMGSPREFCEKWRQRVSPLKNQKSEEDRSRRGRNVKFLTWLNKKINSGEVNVEPLLKTLFDDFDEIEPAPPLEERIVCVIAGIKSTSV